MKTNFKKMISALVLLGLATGCSGFPGSNSTNSSSTTNNSTVNNSVTSSSIANNSGTTSSEVSNSGNQNSSENNGGNSGDIVGGPVSKAEWESALSKEALENVTYDMDASMYQLSASMPFAKAGYVVDMTAKVTSDKIEMVGYETEAAEFEKTGFAAYLEQMLGTPVTEDMLDQYVSMMLGDGDITVTEDTIYYLNDPYLMREYAEYETEETYFEYRFYEDYGQYRKTRELGTIEEANYYMNTFVQVDAYQSAVYDETKGAYKFDGSVLIGEEDMMQGMEFEIDAYYYFVDKKLAKIEIDAVATLEGDTQETSYTLSFYDYGKTSVTLPSADEIRECDHRGYIWESVDENYHYVECGECYSVLEYGRHTEGVCDDCGYYPIIEEILTIPGLHTGIVVEAKYNGLTNELEELHIYRQNGWMNQDSQIDPDTGIETRTYRPEGISDYVVETIKIERVATCKNKETHTYNFYNESGVAYCDPIVTTKYVDSHNYDQRIRTVDPNDPCKVTYTAICSECGCQESEVNYEHNYGEWVEGEKGENCETEFIMTCEDCEHKQYQYRQLHNGTFIDYGNGFGHFSCPDCGADTDGEYDYNGWSQDYHYISFYGLDGNKYYNITASHSYNEEGQCGCGHWKPVEDEGKLEK